MKTRTVGSPFSLDAMRQESDPAADELVRKCFEDQKQNQLYHLLRTPEDHLRPGNPVSDFALTSRPIPAWYDADRLLRGQEFFKRYALAIMTLLGAKSLPFCYAASPGNKALYFTGKIRQTTGKRLVETAAFIIEVMKTGSLRVGAAGHIHINKTRLIHALARYHVLKSGQWNDAWGVPINQEDMAGTNLAFSFVILQGMMESGFPVGQQEMDDFLFVWKYVGYQMHLKEQLLPGTMAEAKELEHAIRVRNFKPSEEGRVLTAELLTHYRESFPAIPAFFIDAQIRTFVGPEVSRMLGLEGSMIKDGLFSGLNLMLKLRNRLNHDEDSYKTMLANHEALKAKFLAPGR